MKISIYYYSGAGNTKFIAQKIKNKLQMLDHSTHLIRITKDTVIDTEESDMIMIGFPVYDLHPPETVVTLVRNLRSTEKSVTYFCTKAFASADSIYELSLLGERRGLRTIARLEVVMPGTDALILFANPGSWMEKMLKFFHTRNLDRKLEKFLSEALAKREINIRRKWYLYFSFLIPKNIREGFHAQYTKYIPEFYSQPDVCIQCMKCVKECPRENIRFDNSIQFGLDCDMCLHCVHHCPTESIQIGTMTQGHVRYRKVDWVG